MATTAEGENVTVIRAKRVIACDGSRHVLLRDAEVAYSNDVIVFVGARYPGRSRRVVDATHHLVAPGFVSCHGHLNSPLSRGFREDGGNRNLFGGNLYDHVSVVGDASVEDCEIAARFSMAELLLGGTTTAVVLGTAIPWQAAKTSIDLGLRSVLIPGYRSGVWVNVDGRRVEYRWDEDPMAGFRGLESNLRFARDVETSSNGLVTSMLGPRQIDTCSLELLRETRRIADREKQRITIHAGQSMVEFREIVDRHGMTPVQLMEDVGLLGPDLLVAHAIFLSGHRATSYGGSGDLDLIAKTGTCVAHCPTVFAQKGQALESLGRYLRRGVTVGLGLDACPQSMLQEMRLATYACKLVDGDFESVLAGDVYHAATIGGADAIGRGDLGRITTGAKADLLVFDLETGNCAPCFDPVRTLVYHAQPSDLTTVIVNGREVVRDGRITGVDLPRLGKQLCETAERVWATVPERDWAGRTAQAIAPPSLPVLAAEEFERLGRSIGDGDGAYV